MISGKNVLFLENIHPLDCAILLALVIRKLLMMLMFMWKDQCT